MLNQVNFIGNLTKDLKLNKTNGSGKAVTNLDIALNYFVNGEKKTEFVKVVAWEKVAEDAVNNLSKGRQVFVDAKVKMVKKQYGDQDVWIPEFHADRIIYLGSKIGGSQQGNNEVPNGFQQQETGGFQQQQGGYQQQQGGFQQNSGGFQQQQSSFQQQQGGFQQNGGFQQQQGGFQQQQNNPFASQNGGNYAGNGGFNR
jgi:single-strand DNA-binding protein